MHRRVLLAVGFIGAAVVACGKFQAAKPDPWQIMHIVNADPMKTDSELPIGDAEPTPIPILPDLPTPLEPYSPPIDVPPPVRPRGSVKPEVGPLGVPVLADPNAAGNRALGRLNYRKHGDSRTWMCSAELVGDVLMTAAHCVHSDGRWHYDVVFLLGYQNGTYRQAINWECTAMWSGWAQGSWSADYAFIKLRSTAPDALGMHLGIPPKPWRAMGYPGEAPYDGQFLYRADGQFGGASGLTIKMAGNTLAKGSSGGAWINDDGFAIGLNSHKRGNDPTMWGPIFTKETVRLYDFVRRGCTDDIIPLGENPQVATYLPDTTYIEPDPRDVSYGPKITYRKSTACPCAEAEEAIVENDSDADYAAEILYGATVGNDMKIASKGKYTVKAPNRRLPSETLGCTRGDGKGNLCDLRIHYSLKIASRNVVIDGQALTVSPDFCRDQCLNHPNSGFCHNFGDAAKPIIATLAGFVTDSLDKAPGPDGVTTTKSELIKSFGGDPNTPDPCNRSDFYREKDEVKNSGGACATTTPAIDKDDPDARRLSLRTPGLAISNRISVPGALGSSAQFTARNTAPVLEFYGKNNEALNKVYGGHVLHVERNSGRLIITTANGCAAGDAK
jgi:hypothetical protein